MPEGKWRCPRCGRAFVNQNARHSCVRVSVEDFFAGYERPFRTFAAIHAFIDTLGGVEMDVTKSQVSFQADARFAWVWLPQMYRLKVPDGGLVLTFDLPRRIDSPRIREAVEIRPGRFTHHVVLVDSSELDEEIRELVREAYEAATIGAFAHARVRRRRGGRRRERGRARPSVR